MIALSIMNVLCVQLENIVRQDRLLQEPIVLQAYSVPLVQTLGHLILILEAPMSITLEKL